MNVLADAAPSGAGLAIVAIVLLAFLALVVGVALWLTVFVVRRMRRRSGGVPAERAHGGEQAEDAPGA